MLKEKLLNNQFVRFSLAGGLAALVNFSSRILIGYYTSYIISIIIAYLIGMSVAYLLCRFFVFSAEINRTPQQIFYFSLINVFALIQTAVISLLFSDYIFKHIADQTLRESMAHFIGVCFPVLTSYMGHKRFTFR